MCGRFYIDDETQSEINKIVKNVELINMETKKPELFPTNSATVLISDNSKFSTLTPSWGFPRWDKKSGVLINARAETVTERKTFKDSVASRRCIIPSAGFYEWDSSKRKIAFFDPDNPVLYLAGFYKKFDNGNRFMIITTAANNSVADVHDRMPLTLNKNELENWLFDPDAYKFILNKTPSKLTRSVVIT